MSYRVLIIVLFAFLLAACSAESPTETVAPTAVVSPTAAPTPTPAQGQGGVLRILWWQAPTILNPHLATGTKDSDVSRIAYEPLASYDPDGQLTPILATEIPSLENGGLAEDGLSVTWQLKPDIRWADGQPFTADDVLFTYEFITNPDTASSSVEPYESVLRVEMVDALTVRVHFRDRNPAWSLPFVGPRGMIIPRHIFEPYNNANAANAPANLRATGTGPYQLVEFVTEDIIIVGDDVISTNKLVFVPNPYFREPGLPYFSRVEIQGGGDANTAAQAVKNGQVDFAWNLQVDASLLLEIEAGEQGRILAVPSPWVERILLNRTDPNQPTAQGERSSLEFPHPIFSDLKVRQALAYAIDREAVAALYGPGNQAASNNLVSPSIYNSPNTSHEFNLQKASDLLDEAGWSERNDVGIRVKDGLEFRILFQTAANPVRQQTQELVQGWFREIGVAVDLKIVDASVYFANDPGNTNTRHHFYADLQMYTDFNRDPNPGPYMAFWTSSQIPQRSNNWTGNNIERWANLEYDALYELTQFEIDLNERANLFVQMNDLLINDVVMIPLVQRAVIDGVSNSLSGVNPTPWDSHLWNIHEWRR